MIISQQLLDTIVTTLSRMPSQWDGRQVIQEWKNSGKEKYWRQMEWIGWRFQELCEQCLEQTQVFDFSEQRYGFADFDAFAEIPWDYKAHIRQNPRGRQTHKVPGTDKRATFQAINDYGAAGFILGLGDAIFNDEDRSFQRWHQSLKGDLSGYEMERRSRGAPSRVRKTAFTLKEIWIVEIDEGLCNDLGTFMEGFRNRDGSPRKAKVMLDLNMISPTYKIPFL
jgi:hypothetical protein